MSRSYDKYKAMTSEQLQKAITDRKVTFEYLNWLGITGPGKKFREITNVPTNHT